MRKKMSAIGNSYGFVIEKPILELLKFDPESEYEVSTDGHRLVIELVEGHRERVRATAKRLIKKHEGTLRKLAK